MKQFIHKVQALGKKAEEIKQAVDSLPGKAAELRQAITMTAGELQQIRTGVQSSIHGLKAESEEHLLKVMREINDHAATFSTAGYGLMELQLDLGLVHRLSVHLQKSREVPLATLSTLHARETIESVKSILSGIIKAEETAANVELTKLRYSGLLIHIGAMPVIRLCWTDDTLMERPQATVLSSSQPQPSQVPLLPTVQTESFFERRPATAPQPQVQALPQTTPEQPQGSLASPAPSAIKIASSPKGGQWAKEALTRFKQMPSASKYGK